MVYIHDFSEMGLLTLKRLCKEQIFSKCARNIIMLIDLKGVGTVCSSVSEGMCGSCFQSLWEGILEYDALSPSYSSS